MYICINKCYEILQVYVLVYGSTVMPLKWSKKMWMEFEIEKSCSSVVIINSVRSPKETRTHGVGQRLSRSHVPIRKVYPDFQVTLPQKSPHSRPATGYHQPGATRLHYPPPPPPELSRERRRVLHVECST